MTRGVTWHDGAAEFSECGRYRYRLERRVAMFDRIATFLMLNPSTATAEVDDPTIRRCIGFARAWTCGTLIVTNIFAYRATDPKEMKAVEDPVGPDNDAAIERAANDAARSGGLLICAWGVHGRHRQRDKAVMELLERVPIEPMALDETLDGSPRHPLYLRSLCRPLRYMGR